MVESNIHNESVYHENNGRLEYSYAILSPAPIITQVSHSKKDYPKIVLIFGGR